MNSLAQNYEIYSASGASKIERIVLPQAIHAEVTVHAESDSTIRLLIESESTVAGSLSLALHPQHRARIFLAICVRVSGSDTLVITSVQSHEKPHGTSHLLVRKIVSDSAVATYHGKIHIASTARSAVVSQDDKTLLDGSHARAESTPVLEVLTNDVACTHGSAIGRVDPQMVWYMQTRGIVDDVARQMLYEAFFDAVRQNVLQES